MINKNIIFATETIIAHGCNCQGKMNSGVAKAIRNRWPIAYAQYMSLYEAGKIRLGTAQLTLVQTDPHKFIANCFTQDRYGYDGQAYASLDAVQSSLEEVAQFAERYSHSVALPPIGCGLGGLSWTQVGPIVDKIFRDHGVCYNVYDYRAENW